MPPGRSSSSRPRPSLGPALPPAFPPQDIVGRWGLAAYHKEEDRPRTEQAAIAGCKQPYVITLGPSGGVMMHLADEATPTELRLKGAPGGKTFIGPADGEAGGAQDREVVSFDGRVLILRWMDSEVQGRYGTMVYVRCGARGGQAASRQTEAEAQDSAEAGAATHPAGTAAAAAIPAAAEAVTTWLAIGA